MTRYGREESATTRYGVYDDARPRSRRLLRTVIIVVVALAALAALLVVLDFGARAFAEAKVASEIQQQGFPKKPNVSIQGFPFLTQVISRDFSDVQISSSDVTEGPLQIASINATMTAVHVNSSFTGGTVGRLNGTLDVTFAALANAMTAEAGGLGSLGNADLTLSQAGPDEVKATLDLVGAGAVAIWQVTRADRNEINIRLVSLNGLTSGLLGSLADVNVLLPSLPAGLSIRSITVTPNGLAGTVTGQNLSFSE